MKKLAIIILNWNGTEDTIECLESLELSEVYDVFVLDNGSRDEEKRQLLTYIKRGKYKDSCIVDSDVESIKEKNGCLKVVDYRENLGFAGGNNYIAENIYADYEYIMLLNNDTEVEHGAINSMIHCIESSSCVAITCDIRNYYHKKVLWNAGGKFTIYGDRKYYSQKKIDQLKTKGIKFIQADFITGCALLIKSSYIEKYGLFTKRFFHGEEDFNFCKNAKKRNAKLGVDLGAVIFHKVGRTLKHNTSDKQRTLNAKVLHYSNRIIDYQEFFTRSIWRVWREFYLFLVFVKHVIDNREIRTAKALIKRIRIITSSCNEINRQTFSEIMQFNQWEENSNGSK